MSCSIQPKSASPRPPPANLRVWLADLTYTQQTVAADVIPNAVGGIATFTETRLAFPEPIRIFKYPEKLAVALENEGFPDIIGFSNYIWNSSLSYEFTKLIKRRSPKTVVVWGGLGLEPDTRIAVTSASRHELGDA